MAGATGLYSSLPCVLNDVVMIILLQKTSKMPLNWRAPSIFSKFFFPVLSCYLFSLSLAFLSSTLAISTLAFRSVGLWSGLLFRICGLVVDVS